MRIICDDHIFPGWVVTKLRPPQLSGTFLVKATYRLEAGRAVPVDEEPDPVTGDTAWEDDPTRGLMYASDFAPFKPRTDVLVAGTAFAPGGTPVSHLLARVRIGPVDKTLRITGDRSWERGLFSSSPSTDPEPFTEMPISWDRAFGGPDYAQNPVGRGKGTDALPNVESPDALIRSRRQSEPPAGFGPLAPEWEPRSKMTGSYRGKWTKERWPWYPDDFDLGFYNAAPPDQQLVEPLRGDEEIELQNLHPEREVILSRLPGERARFFLEETVDGGENTWREVPLHLDTVWLRPDELKLVLVWRGYVDVRTPKLKEVAVLFALTEPIDDPVRDAAHYRRLLDARLAAMEEEEVEPEEVPEEPDTTEEEIAAIEAEFAAVDDAAAAADKHAAEQESRGTEAFATFDHAPAAPFAAKPPLMTPAAAGADFAASSEAMKAESPDHAEASAEAANSFAEMEQAEKEVAELEEPELPGLTRDDVVRMLAAGESLAETDLSELDLSGLDFSNADLSGCDLRKTALAGAVFRGATLAGAVLREADLAGADFTGAMLEEADFTATAITGAIFRDTALAGALFSALDLTGFDFRGASGHGVDFSGAVLTRARFSGVDMPQVDFTGCVLEEADFTGARLRAGQFEEVKGVGIVMEDAFVEGLHASDGSDFSRGNFRRIQGAGSIWSGSRMDDADYSGAHLEGALFSEASLRGAILDRVWATGAGFDDGILADARLTDAKLVRCSFQRTDLRGAVLDGSNLYDAGFFESLVEDATFRQANLKGTLLG